MMPTLIEQMDRVPPCIARICARTGWRAKTLDEIAKDSQLSSRKVCWIARQPTWAKVRVEDAVRFAQACGLDLIRPRKKLFYLKRAYTSSEFRILSAGLTRNYVVRQILIRKRYEQSQSARLGRREPTKVPATLPKG